MKNKLVLSSILVAWVALIGFAGCNPEQEGENNNNPPIAGDPDVGPDIDVADTEPDPCEGVECGEQEVCVEGGCETIVEQGYGCADPFDLGMLTGDEIHELQANPQGKPNLMNTSCSADDKSAQAVFMFTVENTTRIDTRITDTPIQLVTEFRSGSCTDDNNIEMCTLNDANFIAEPDTTYYMIVEAYQGGDNEFNDSGFINEFSMELETQEQLCSPAGSLRCEEDEILLCFAGTEERRSQCAAGCEEAECLGNSCGNALEITSSQTVTGDYSAYESRFDFSDSESCSSSGTIGLTTPGRDMVFSLPGLSVGQNIEVEVVNGGLNVIGVMDACSEATAVCINADSEHGILNWAVEADGDYFVVITPRTTPSGSFEYRFNIE